MEEIRWKSDRQKYENHIKELQQKAVQEKKINSPERLTRNQIIRWMIERYRR